MSVKAHWPDAAVLAPDDSDPFEDYTSSEVQTVVGRNNGAAPVPAPSRNGNGRVPEADIWARRADTDHPMPVGYWLESRYSMDTPLKELEGRLALLVKREMQCEQVEITCPIKDLPDMTCSACPVNEVGQDTRKSVLCRLGREQERIAALILAKGHSDG